MFYSVSIRSPDHGGVVVTMRASTGARVEWPRAVHPIALTSPWQYNSMFTEL